MNIIRPSLLLACALPCVAAEQPPPTAEHKDKSEKLAERQDNLQADTSDIILGETNPKVIDLLKRCRNAMNDAVDLLEEYETGGKTTAAQSEVIELIYQAAKEKNTGSGGEPKPGGQAMMDMLRQLLGMDSESSEGQSQPGNQPGGQPGNAAGEQEGENANGKKPGKGGNGKSDMASSQQTGVSNPDMAAEDRSVPKATGVSSDDMPAEFRKALEAYNKTLQK